MLYSYVFISDGKKIFKKDYFLNKFSLEIVIRVKF